MNNIKTTIFLLIISILLSFSACSKDIPNEEQVDLIESPIIENEITDNEIPDETEKIPEKIPEKIVIEQYDDTQKVLMNVFYKNTKIKDLTVDIYQPTTRLYQKNPTIIFFHGGSWVAGKKDLIWEFQTVVETLREQGFAFVTVDYRFADDEFKYREVITDCIDAVKWVVKNAENYDFDVENLNTMGFSSGAHLALMTALAQEDYSDSTDVKYEIKKVISASAPINFDMDYLKMNAKKYETYTFTIPMLENFIGETYENMKNDYFSASPFAFLSENMSKKPEILLIHGSNDEMVDITNSETFFNSAANAGFDVKFQIINNATHRFFTNKFAVEPTLNEIYEIMIDFIN